MKNEHCTLKDTAFKCALCGHPSEPLANAMYEVAGKTDPRDYDPWFAAFDYMENFLHYADESLLRSIGQNLEYFEKNLTETFGEDLSQQCITFVREYIEKNIIKKPFIIALLCEQKCCNLPVAVVSGIVLAADSDTARRQAVQRWPNREVMEPQAWENTPPHIRLAALDTDRMI